MRDQTTTIGQLAKFLDMICSRGEYADLAKKVGNVTRAHMQARLDDPEGFYHFLRTGKMLEREAPKKQETKPSAWIASLIERERQYWLGSPLAKSGEFDFSNLDFSRMFNALEKKGEEWHQTISAQLRKVCYIPRLHFREGMKIPGWIWLEQWFFDQKKAGKLFVMNRKGVLVPNKSLIIPEQMVIIDTRLKPAYDNGNQMWDQDEQFCGAVIRQLREEGKIQNYTQVSSRFNVSPNEWQNHIRPLLAEQDGIKVNQMKWEPAALMNLIPQVYTDLSRAKDGITNTSVWLEEYFGGASDRLYGGDSDDGGLALVAWFDCDSHWNDRSFRPLGVVA